METVCVRLLVSGLVQGVGYRAFVLKAARQSHLTGGVRNLEDGRVEVEAEGSRDAVNALIRILRAGPPNSRVEHLDIEWKKAADRHKDFRIWYS
ncbi:MAG: acylphosphatase [Nitrospiraceae bacterium]